MATDKNTPSITLAPDGPYIVKNLPELSNQHGPIPTEATMALCRCGASNNKPFCDGSHNAIGFSSKNESDPSADKQTSYQGRNITIHDNRSICAHAGVCTDELSTVFRLHESPFIDPDGSTAESIIEVINKCPSGALSYSLENTEQVVDEQRQAIFIAPDGPYVVTGEIDLADTPRAEGCLKTKTTLCRCGASKNKPFCDGSHWGINFKAD